MPRRKWVRQGDLTPEQKKQRHNDYAREWARKKAEAKKAERKKAEAEKRRKKAKLERDKARYRRKAAAKQAEKAERQKKAIELAKQAGMSEAEKERQQAIERHKARIEEQEAYRKKTEAAERAKAAALKRQQEAERQKLARIAKDKTTKEMEDFIRANFGKHNVSSIRAALQCSYDTVYLIIDRLGLRDRQEHVPTPTMPDAKYRLTISKGRKVMLTAFLKSEDRLQNYKKRYGEDYEYELKAI